MNITVKRQGIEFVPYIRPAEIIRTVPVCDSQRYKAHLK